MFLQAVAGLIADARQVVGRARDEAANYRFTYAQPIPLKVYSSPRSSSVSVCECLPLPSTWWTESRGSCTYTHCTVLCVRLAVVSCLGRMVQTDLSFTWLTRLEWPG